MEMQLARVQFVETAAASEQPAGTQPAPLPADEAQSTEVQSAGLQPAKMLTAGVQCPETALACVLSAGAKAADPQADPQAADEGEPGCQVEVAAAAPAAGTGQLGPLPPAPVPP